jgi:uncharacterized protein (TIGR03435 family)
MLQKLLADRFHLTLHREKRELPVYAIAVAKSGPRVTRNENDPDGLPRFSAGPRVLSMTNGTMADLADVLQSSAIVDRPVVDQTGLGSARYDFIVRWTPLSPEASPAGGPPDLFTAFQEQLGLKLESANSPVDVLVIDRVEKPSAN